MTELVFFTGFTTMPTMPTGLFSSKRSSVGFIECNQLSNPAIVKRFKTNF